MITLSQIRSGAQWITQDRLDKYGQHLINAMTKFSINTTPRIAAFLAQVMHESGELKYVAENLNYSAVSLLKTFPKYFDVAMATQYAHQPQRIANRVYANRMGNGDEASGEGFKYRGQGLIQITGKDNYGLVTLDLNIDFVTKPELLQLPQYAALSAAWFWNKHKLNLLADKNDEESFKAITKVINGGLNGYASRFKYWVDYKHAME